MTFQWVPRHEAREFCSIDGARGASSTSPEPRILGALLDAAVPGLWGVVDEAVSVFHLKTKPR